MKLQFFAVTAVLLAASASVDAAEGESTALSPSRELHQLNTATERPNALSLELLGRGGYYSVNYDRSFSSYLAGGVGFSYVTTSDFFTNASALIIPFYANVYTNPGSNRAFFTVGVDLLSGSENLSILGTAPGITLAPIVGAGYEYRGRSGFLFRAAPYVALVGSSLGFTLGASFGETF